jgi:hypothetical protein
MRFIFVLSFILLAGCAGSVPVTMHFPQLPEVLTERCDKLEPLDPTKRELSDLIENATDNYGKHYECEAKLNAWTDWYNTQKKIHEEIK